MDDGAHLLDGLDLVRPFGARLGEVDRQALLEGVGTHRGGGHLTAQREDGRRVAARVLQRRDDIRKAGAGRREDDANLARRARVALGRVAAALLRAVHHKVDRRVGELVEDGQVGAAGVAEDGVDAALDERLVDELAARHAGKAQVVVIVVVQAARV